MGNIFRQELIQQYLSPAASINGSGVGELVQRNGFWAMSIKPVSYYYQSAYRHILEDYFNPSTQYVFDMWIDRDENISSSGSPSTAGIQIWYTDGTRDTTHLYRIDSAQPNAGFVHDIYITPADKSVDYISIGYNYNRNCYYRADSYICPLDEINLHKTGVLNMQNATEFLCTPPSDQNLEIMQGTLKAKEIIEL